MGGETRPAGFCAVFEAERLGGLFRSFFVFCVFFLCVVFLFDLGSFWDAQMGRFGSQKSIKMRLMSFCFLLFFLLVFPLLLRLGRVLCWFYIGSFFASFFASIFRRFGS